MAVTIAMIEQKEFQVVPSNGYDPDEVDRFLDEIVDELERLQKEIRTLRQEQSSPSRRTVGGGPGGSSSPSEETVRSMLMNAQRVCDDTISDSKKRAEETLRQARDEADEIIRTARSDETALNAENDALRSAVSDYRANFRRMLEDQMRWLKEEV
ncbi:MAG: DivIVA domain-containing protein [Oscillospiraceae bacterium]|nr:DivIVA domain-containing protein [Oscillospiraceae bacterium]